MLTHPKEHQIHDVIVHKLDCLARSGADDVAITQAVNDPGAHHVSSAEGINASVFLHGIARSQRPRTNDGGGE